MDNGGRIFVIYGGGLEALAGRGGTSPAKVFSLFIIHYPLSIIHYPLLSKYYVIHLPPRSHTPPIFSQTANLDSPDWY
jgi:hypothetical protein